MLIAVSVTAEFTTIARPDTGFLLYAAGRVLDGATLYVDVVEINPPLIVALNVPPVLIARALGTSDILIYRLGTAVVLAALLALSAVLARKLLPDDWRPLRHGFLLLLAFVLFPLAGQDFGEREHFMLALTMPYVLVACLRASKQAVSTRLALGVGCLAGIGIALKPHFILLWLALELYHWRRERRVRWPAPESLTAAAFLVAYAATVLVVTPEYLRLVATFGPMYARFLYVPFAYLLVSGPGAALTLLALLAYLALRRHASRPELWDVLALAAAAFLLAGAAQQKGLRYHFYPSFAVAIVLLGVAALDVRQPLPGLVARIYRVVSAAVVVTSLVVVSATHLLQIAGSLPGSRRADPFHELVTLVRRHAAGESILVLSYHIGSAFPLVNYTGTISASRFPQLWVLAAAYLDDLHAEAPLRYRSRPEMGATERLVFEAVRADMTRHRPKLLIVLKHARDVNTNGLRRIDYLAYFGRDPGFARLFQEYQLLADIGEYRVYERLDDGRPRRAAAPMPSPGTHDVRRRETADVGGLLSNREFAASLLVFLITLTALAALEVRRDKR